VGVATLRIAAVSEPASRVFRLSRQKVGRFTHRYGLPSVGFCGLWRVFAISARGFFPTLGQELHATHGLALLATGKPQSFIARLPGQPTAQHPTGGPLRRLIDVQANQQDAALLVLLIVWSSDTLRFSGSQAAQSAFAPRPALSPLTFPNYRASPLAILCD